MTVTEERDAALREFAAARDEFERAYAPVPDAALKYLPEGDDYALGGLIVHVTNAMQHYVDVLRQIKAAHFGQIRAAEGSGETPEMLHRLKYGFEGSELTAMIDRMRVVHDDLDREIRGLSEGDYPRKAPVLFGTSAEPFPTGAEEILGWMTPHYRDHVDQVAKMLSEWQKS